MRGRNTDLAKLPAPYWHSKDGGPFIRLGLDRHHARPDGGWINASIYRVQVHGRNRVTIQFDHPGRHGAIIAQKYWDKGKGLSGRRGQGEDPALFIAGFEYLPDGQSEFDFAGAIKGGPMEMMPGPVTGLPLPAHAEIVLEGGIAPAEPAHLAGRAVRRIHRLLRRRGAALPVMQVSAITTATIQSSWARRR